MDNDDLTMGDYESRDDSLLYVLDCGVDTDNVHLLWAVSIWVSISSFGVFLALGVL